MRENTRPPARGFTLIELLIAMSIFLLVLLGIYQVFDTNRATYLSGTRKVDIQQNARVALDQIAREIRMAGYFPENFTAATLTNPQPIQIAQDTALAILGDADGNGASRLFLYCLSGTNIIRKWTAVTFVGGVFTPTPPVQAYTCSEENLPNVRVGAVLAERVASLPLHGLNGLKFTYYDGNNLPIPNPMPASKTTAYTLDGEGVGAVPPFGTVAQRSAVRTVVITIVATEAPQGVSVPGQQPQSFTLTSSVRLRNL